jgi:hypothetical protein
VAQGVDPEFKIQYYKKKKEKEKKKTLSLNPPGTTKGKKASSQRLFPLNR